MAGAVAVAVVVAVVVTVVVVVVLAEYTIIYNYCIQHTNYLTRLYKLPELKEN